MIRYFCIYLISFVTITAVVFAEESELQNRLFLQNKILLSAKNLDLNHYATTDQASLPENQVRHEKSRGKAFLFSLLII